MEIKLKPRPLNALNSSTQEHTVHFISGTNVGTSAHRKTLGTLSWVFKEEDYSIVIGNGSPCGSVSSH